VRRRRARPRVADDVEPDERSDEQQDQRRHEREPAPRGCADRRIRLVEALVLAGFSWLRHPTDGPAARAAAFLRDTATEGFKR
jgi:hypothetical protein